MKLEESKKITIPCHWNREVINQIISDNSGERSLVVEVYGSLAVGGPVGHGRASEAVVAVSKEEALEFRRFLDQKGLTFTYLLNAPVVPDYLLEKKKEVEEYLEWILFNLNPDAVTVSSVDLARVVRVMDKGVDIHVSTIAGVKKPEDLESFLDAQPNRIVPHHDLGKDWLALEELSSFVKSLGMEIELLSTESCLLGCENRQAHYRRLSGVSGQDVPFHKVCNTKKLTRPREFLLAGGFVRPEDMEFYREKGVDLFKISGRSKLAQWLPEVAKAYQIGSYDGNLIRLLGIDPSLKAEEWIFLDNKSLNGFIEGFPQGVSRSEINAYCDKWILRLYKEGAFKVTDGSEYEFIEGELRLKTPGGRVCEVISRELRR